MTISAADTRSFCASLDEDGLLDLRDLGDLVAGSISVKDAFRYVASRVCEWVGSDGSRLLLLDQDRKHLVEDAAWEWVGEHTSDAAELAATCFSSKKIMLGGRDETSPGSSSAVIPLMRGTETIGVLQLHFSGREMQRGPSTSSLELIQDLVSPVIVRSMIYERSLAKAHMDGVTSLPNERAFDTICEKKIVEAIRGGRPLSLVVLDINNFEAINGRLGHAVGDEVLRWVAEIARSNLRDMDVIARSHDDEFLVVLPTASEEETLAIISRIRDGMTQADMPSEFDGIQKVELSFGWGVLGTDGHSTRSLLTRARLRKGLSKTSPTTENILIFPASKPGRHDCTTDPI